MGSFNHFANRIAGALGYHVSRLPKASELKNQAPVLAVDTKELPVMESGLERTKFQKTFFNTVIDIGSSDGRWSE